MSKKVEFTPPKAFQAPEGKSPGDEFEEMAKFRIKPDGQLCLVELGGVDMPGYKDDDAEDATDKEPMKSEPEGRNMMNMGAMGGGGMGGEGY